MGQTKCCWGHGPAAWMHHKDLPLPCFFTLLQNKLSLDCFFSPQAKLSPEPDTEVAGRSWLQVHPWPSLSSSAFFEFWWCFPSPSSGLVCLFLPPALSTPYSTFLHPSVHGFHCSFHPQQTSFLHCSAARTPKLPVPQCCSCPGDPCSAQWPLFPPAALPKVCTALPKLCDPQPISPLTYFLFQNFSCLLSLLAVVHPGQLWGLGLPTAVRAQGLWQSYSGLCQTRALLVLSIKPPGTPLISPAFFPLLFYCRGPCFFRGERTKYGVSIPSCLSAFLLALCSFPCTRHKFSSSLSSLPLCCLFLPVALFLFPPCSVSHLPLSLSPCHVLSALLKAKLTSAPTHLLCLIFFPHFQDKSLGHNPVKVKSLISSAWNCCCKNPELGKISVILPSFTIWKV